MALTYDRVKLEIDAFLEMCDRTNHFLSDIQRLLQHNSTQAIDWNAGSTPAYISQETNGNLSGYQFTRQNIGNAIGSLNAIVALLTNQSLAGLQGDHLGNINLIAPAQQAHP